jgi:signal transduction histidine kinase/ActR/RegA family two-component response regulator
MSLWKTGSIHNRLILIALAPALMLGLVVFAYFVSARLDDLGRQLQDTGMLIAEQLAPTAEYGVISGNLNTLESLIKGALDTPHVRSVEVYDQAGDLMVSLQSTAQQKTPLPLHYFSADIQRQSIALQNELYLLDAPATELDDNFRYLGQVRVGLSREAFDERQEDILFGALLLAALVIFAALVLALRLASALSSPLARMSRAVQALQEGHLETRLEEDQQHEIGVLMHNINTLASTLQRSAHEQQQAMEHMNSAREDAEAANRAKSDFLAMMSHELRTPMNGVLGMLQLLETTVLNAEQAEYVQIAGESTDHLLHVINDILDFSRIERGALELEEIAFNLPELISHSAAVFEHTAAQKGLALNVRTQGNPPTPNVLGDPTRIRQILVNLIGNALKFTEQGNIDVEAHWHKPAHGQCVELICKVSDSGIGIAPGRLESMFHAFQQADSSTSRRFGGTGLGLSIARTFAVTMGGSLEAQSTEGLGSCFTLRLTLPLTENDPETSGNATTTNSAPANQLPVLLVEDNPVNQMVIEGMLHSLGYQVVTAETGQTALRLLTEHGQAFSAILMDLQLPDIDGFSVYRRYLAHCASQERTPVSCIALTASAMQSDRQQCTEAGMQGFISKPVSRKALQQELGACLRPGAADY